ncbi:abortive infection family protein [Pseudonocardia sp. ICBG162]|uniref:abortive infection family protein n=1 Tax=Pseudonocardia sp. ICBG162 TaxID=2846761 RepID=UPI001CF7172E|nr:abortive infection family protein [Pseudonocardia sp. ICBG162]
MDLIELGSALGGFFDPELGQVGPSHDQIRHAVARAGLTPGDPRETSETVGKTKRVREVMIYATDHDPAAGLKFAGHIVSLLRASNRFLSTSGDYAGETRITGARSAFERIGYDLDASGSLRLLVIDNLSGVELSDALASYVRRINLNPNDGALQVGSGKELDEATARHVLNEKVGGYSQSGPSGNFPVTLAGAFTALGMKVPPSVPGLDKNPHRQVEECLFLLACAVNRLRNESGTGHGRPTPPTLTDEEARLAARATALIAGALLDRL